MCCNRGLIFLFLALLDGFVGRDEDSGNPDENGDSYNNKDYDGFSTHKNGSCIPQPKVKTFFENFKERQTLPAWRSFLFNLLMLM